MTSPTSLAPPVNNPVQDGTLIPITGNILAAGPLSHQPHSTPYRVVLCSKPDGSFVVTNQYFNDDGKTSYATGNYFKPGPENLVNATKRFAERVAVNATYLASLYHEPRKETP